MKRIVALSIGLWITSWTEAEVEVSVQKMLPLVVGNRWEYSHSVKDSIGSTYFSQDVTVSITHMEYIEGRTYYVFSDMPYEQPPVPYFFIAGKKVRWEGNHLLFRQQDRDVALYQFRDQEIYDYPISETASDTLVSANTLLEHTFFPGSPIKAGCVVRGDPNPFDWSVFNFYFTGHKLDLNPPWYGTNPWTRKVSFLVDFGMVDCYMTNRNSQGNPIGENHLTSYEAVISGVKWGFWNDPRKTVAGSEELPCLPSVVGVSSWGVLKRKFTCPDCED